MLKEHEKNHANETSSWKVKEKWGSAVDSGETGFLAVPDVLIKKQAEMLISATEMNVLLNILLHWWSAEELPFPRPSVMATRMGVSTRTVERAIASLENRGLIVRKESEKTEKGLTVRRFDLSNLVKQLQLFAGLYRVSKKKSDVPPIG